MPFSEQVSTDEPVNVVDPDFSTSYTSADNNSLTFDFGATTNISYVAVAGTNIQGSKDFSSYLSVSDGDTLLATNYVSSNNCIVLTFPSQSFANLRITLFNALGDKAPQLHFSAAGNYLEIPNGGEQSGYDRQFLKRNIKTVATLNSNSAPVALLTYKVGAKGRLNIPNANKSFSEQEWQKFLDFSEVDYFFIQEQQPESFAIEGETSKYNNDSSYLCFEPRGSIKAHSQTRSLNNISLNFRVFNNL